MSYYLRKKPKLLKDFDRTANLMQDYLVNRYGQNAADTLYKQTRQQYEALIPEIPHIKGIKAGFLNSFLLIVAQELALYRTMKKQDKELGEIWELCHEAIKLRMAKFPKFKRWLLYKLMFSKFLLRRVKGRAERGEQLKFGDFEIRYIIGNGKDFDWGVDYVACGHCTFLKAQGAEEFAPYVCLSDMALGDALGWGLTRTQTIADSCEYCDFRFKKGAETNISSKTPQVQRTIEIIGEIEVKDT